ncbi:MAG: apolipoprotein N-acyltransferase [Bacillota bacterium]|nr:apolipoprotein N-acyltransferase [Bacillota bacterium]
MASKDNTHTYIYLNLLLPLFSGAILIFAFPPFEQGYLSWFVLAPLIFSILLSRPGQAFLAGIIFAIPINLYLNLYLSHVLFPYLPFTLALAAMFLLVLYISLFSGLFAYLSNMMTKHVRPLFAVYAIPAIWVIVEYLRSIGFLAYNVGYLGYSQWNYPYMLNLASTYGYWGLPFTIVSFQTIIIFLALGKLEKKDFVLALAVLLLFIGCGFLIPSIQAIDDELPSIRTALIQGNSSPDEIISLGKERIREHYLEMTREALEEDPGVKLVVWPETVVDLDFRRNKTHQPEMLQVAEELGIAILYGARVVEGDNLYNSILLLRDNQLEIPVYNKQRLVPFVEYFPFEEILNNILNLQLLLGRYTAGEEIVIFEINDSPLAGVICFESYFGDHSRLFSFSGGRHLFVLTNDAWFGRSIGLELHAQAAAIRAAEMGIGVTQVANSGITISYDHKGNELFRSGKDQAGVFITDIEFTRRPTVYSRYGDYFPLILFFYLLTGLLYNLHQKLKK